METITVLARDLCEGDIVLGLEDNVERVVTDVWYTTGFPTNWKGKSYRGGYCIDFADGVWISHAHDRPLTIKRPPKGRKKSKSVVSILYRYDIPKSKGRAKAII